MIPARRALVQRSFRDFVAWAWPLMTGAPYVPNQITERIIATLQQVGDGELWRVIICCPPGVGKSTLLACYSAWRFARSPGHRAIHAGHSFDLARDESLRVRRLVDGDEYRCAFQGVRIRDDQNQAGRWSTTWDGRYIAVGTDGGLTGIRAHEGILDDPMNATDRFSPAARESLWRWFLEAFSTRLDGDRAPVVIVAQRLDRDDLPGRLLESGRPWHLVEIPAELEDGTLLAPNVLSRETLDGKRAESASTYACQYLQRPNDDSTALVPRRFWGFHRPAHVAETTPRPLGCDTTRPAVETPTEFTHVVIAVDMTFGATGAKNDYAVVQAWGSVGAARYLLAQWRAKATQMAQRDAIKQMRAEYPTAPIIVEKAAGGQGAVEILTADGFTGVIGVTTGGKSKKQRFALVSPAIEAGNCYLPLGANWLGDYVEELAGATRHDDAQDTTAYALARLAIDEGHGETVIHGGFSSESNVDYEHTHSVFHPYERSSW